MESAFVASTTEDGSDRTELVADGLMTVKEAAEFLSVSRSTLYTMMDAGELASVKIGRCRRIPRVAVVQLAAERLRGGGRFG